MSRKPASNKRPGPATPARAPGRIFCGLTRAEIETAIRALDREAIRARTVDERKAAFLLTAGFRNALNS